MCFGPFEIHPALLSVLLPGEGEGDREERNKASSARLTFPSLAILREDSVRELCLFALHRFYTQILESEPKKSSVGRLSFFCFSLPLLHPTLPLSLIDTH